MIHHFAELNPRKIAVLLILALVAFRMGMSVVDDVLHVPESLSESCQSQEDVIKQLLDTGNYCTTNNDCVAIPFNCPFGCNTYLNLSIETAPIQKKITTYTEQCGHCVTDCMQTPPVCVNNRCMSFETLTSP